MGRLWLRCDMWCRVESPSGDHVRSRMLVTIQLKSVISLVLILGLPFVLLCLLSRSVVSGSGLASSSGTS